ncbi:ATP-dependent zinc metalloprotease FTSH 10 like, partial [Actinidia chinensis var. chinensis]
MIFSRFGRSLSQSSPARNGVSGGRSALVNGTSLRSSNVDSYISRFDEKLGFLRGYLASIGACKEFASKAYYLSDLNYVLANPRLRRFFSSEAPKKKNYENFCPKNKKEIPNGKEQKSESKEDANTGDHGSFQETFMKQFQNLITPLLVIGLFLSSFSFGPREQQQISFQEFKNKLLEPGLVDHVVVSNKSVAKVYVRSSPRSQTSDDFVGGTVVQGPANGAPAKGNKSQYKYYFNIGSIESFEEKLEEAQEALGIDPPDYVPVTYASEMVWYQELMRFAPTLLLLGTLWYMGRRMQGGLGVGGGGGKG